MPTTLRLSLIGALLAPLALTQPVSAQEMEAGNWAVSVEVFGGLATVGRFLEQAGPGNTEREITANNAAAYGASIGVQPWESTGLSFGVVTIPTMLAFKDDTGLGSTSPAIENDEVGDLDMLVVSGEAKSSVLGSFGVLRPYTVVGVAAGWFALEDAPAAVNTGAEDTRFSFGGSGGLGVEIRPSDALILRLEASQFRLGNPFDGRDAWRADDFETFDEPTSVRISRYTVGLGYSFGG